MSRKRRRAKAEAVKVMDEAAVLRGRRFGAVILALVLAGIPFAVGKYIEFNSPGAFDSGAYVYSAKHILEGARIGIEEKVSARPGTLLMNVIGVWLFGFNEFGPKLIQGLLQAGALVMMFWTMRRLFGTAAAVVGVTVAAVYLSAPVISKFGNVKEQFMIAFMLVGGCCFVLGQMEDKWWWKVLSGAALINAFYFKPTGVSIIIAVIIFVLVGVLLRRQRFGFFLKEIYLMLVGGFAGLFPLFVLYGLHGSLRRLINTLPMLCLRLALAVMVVLTLAWAVIRIFKKYEVLRQLKTVRCGVWKTGCVLLVLTVALVVVGGVLVKYFWAEDAGNAISYVKDITFIKYPLRLYVKSEVILRGIMRRVSSGYVTGSRGKVSLSEQGVKVFRYYKVLSLPICLSIGSLLLYLCRCFFKISGKIKEWELADRLLIFLGVWWILDMAFVWISARSYEQYYLPLNASGVFLGGYLIWVFSRKLQSSVNKGLWKAVGAVGVVCMVLMSQNIFLGMKKSPDTGADYRNPRSGAFERRRGFAQRLNEISGRRKNNYKYPWEQVGEYIGQNSGSDDKIYVWGWYPGIYIKAQRLSSASKGFESDMHVKSPVRLGRQVGQLVLELGEEKPRFIVDSRKRHFPWDRPQLELWPRLPKGFMGAKKTIFLPLDEKVIEQYDLAWAGMLRKQFGEDEGGRYEAMKPFREFVMKNYSIVSSFGEHVLFKLKEEAAVGRVEGG